MEMEMEEEEEEEERQETGQMEERAKKSTIRWGAQGINKSAAAVPRHACPGRST
jgi:hypothetical protein